MGWCHDFNVEIAEGCSRPMRAGVSYCTCPECGVVCRGKFDGCKEVWIKLPSRSTKRTAGGAHDRPRAPAPPVTGPVARTVRLTEPVEVPPSGGQRSPAASPGPPPRSPERAGNGVAPTNERLAALERQVADLRTGATAERLAALERQVADLRTGAGATAERFEAVLARAQATVRTLALTDQEKGAEGGLAAPAAPHVEAMVRDAVADQVAVATRSVHAALEKLRHELALLRNEARARDDALAAAVSKAVPAPGDVEAMVSQAVSEQVAVATRSVHAALDEVRQVRHELVLLQEEVDVRLYATAATGSNPEAGTEDADDSLVARRHVAAREHELDIRLAELRRRSS